MRENFTYINNDWMGGELQLKNPYEREVFAHISRMTTYGLGGWQGSVRELAERLYYPKSTIAKAVSSLIQKGLIQKSGQKYIALKTAPETAAKNNEPQEAQPQSVQNIDTDVHDMDTKVHDMDNNVPNSDSLPPTTPIINNKKESLSKSNNNDDKAGTKEEEKIINSFESFWALYKVPFKWQDEKDHCLYLWKNMTPLCRNLVLEDLEEFPQRDPNGPVSYLQYFKPRSPFYLMDDEVESYLSDGIDLARVNTYNGKRYATLKEAKLFDMNILRTIPARPTT